jgi:hypothetical protein
MQFSIYILDDFNHLVFSAVKVALVVMRRTHFTAVRPYNLNVTPPDYPPG